MVSRYAVLEVRNGADLGRVSESDALGDSVVFAALLRTAPLARLFFDLAREAVHLLFDGAADAEQRASA